MGDALMRIFDEHRNVGLYSEVVTPGRPQRASGLWRVRMTSPFSTRTWVACAILVLC